MNVSLAPPVTGFLPSTRRATHALLPLTVGRSSLGSRAREQGEQPVEREREHMPAYHRRAPARQERCTGLQLRVALLRRSDA